MPVSDLHVVRVFVDEEGKHGNPLGVFLDGSHVAAGERQAIARDLGFAETVFVDDRGRGELRIFTPGLELPLAGHPLVGTAWLLERAGYEISTLRPPAGEVPTWREADLTWIRARPEWSPPFELRELDAPAEVDAHSTPGPDAMLQIWAWASRDAGRVRARVFPGEAGIDEDEATGSAAMQLVAELGRPVAIEQGTGSLLHARPGPGGTAEVGGRVAHVRAEPYEWRHA